MPDLISSESIQTPQVPSWLPDELAEVINLCLTPDHKMRPSFTKVGVGVRVTELESFRSQSVYTIG